MQWGQATWNLILDQLIWYPFHYRQFTKFNGPAWAYRSLFCLPYGPLLLRQFVQTLSRPAFTWCTCKLAPASIRSKCKKPFSSIVPYRSPSSEEVLSWESGRLHQQMAQSQSTLPATLFWTRSRTDVHEQPPSRNGFILARNLWLSFADKTILIT